jgi:hypothetical protein
MTLTMLHPPPSSPGLTGGSSTLRPIDLIIDALEYWIVRSSRTMTNVGVLAARCARVLQNSFRPKKKRAQGRPGARCTRGLMCQCICKKTAHEHTGSAEAVRPSLRNGFTTYIVLSPARPGLFVTVAPKKRELPKNLTPAIGASGPHDFAVRITRCSSKAHRRPPLPAPNVRDDRETPLLVGTGWQGISR